jgi:hypothetical protein
MNDVEQVETVLYYHYQRGCIVPTWQCNTTFTSCVHTLYALFWLGRGRVRAQPLALSWISETRDGRVGVSWLGW